MYFPRNSSNFSTINNNRNYQPLFSPIFNKNTNNSKVILTRSKPKPCLLTYKDKNIPQSIYFRNDKNYSYINYTKLKTNNSIFSQKAKNYLNNKELQYNTINNFRNLKRNLIKNKSIEKLKTLSPNIIENKKPIPVLTNYTERQFNNKKGKEYFATIDNMDRKIKSQRNRNNYKRYINTEKQNIKNDINSQTKKLSPISNKLNELKEMKNTFYKKNKKILKEDNPNPNINNSTISSDSEVNLGFKIIKPNISQNSIYNITPDKRKETYIQKPLLLKGVNKPKLNVPNYSNLNIHEV